VGVTKQFKKGKPNGRKGGWGGKARGGQILFSFMRVRGGSSGLGYSGLLGGEENFKTGCGFSVRGGNIA